MAFWSPLNHLALRATTSSAAPVVQVAEYVNPKNVNIHHLSMGQLDVLHIITVSLSAVSLCAGLATSFFFFRMRRGFRHDLIMTLILCDMFKAIWFMAFPAVSLAYGNIDSESAFCQASGFFLEWAFEASDIAVAMIALHTALYIFRGEEGLYPYRKIAYSVFCFVPVVFSALAFINSPGYVNTGSFCYLPIHPVWTRRALSWVPRYLAFAAIIFTYIAIYVYVRILMRQYAKMGDTRRDSVSLLDTAVSVQQQPDEVNAVPATPQIIRHGLISSSASSNRTSMNGRGRQFSVSTMYSMNLDTPPPAAAYNSRFTSKTSRNMDQFVDWKKPGYGAELDVPRYQETSRAQPDLADPEVAHYLTSELTTPTETHSKESERSLSDTQSDTPPMQPMQPATSRSFWHRSAGTTVASSRSPSVPNIFAVMSRNQGGSGTANIALDPSNVIKTREKIHRQLRQLFIYPMVYVFVWVLPFVVHLTGFGGGAPYPLVICSLIFLSLQGLADAAVFSLKETPWRHIRTKGQKTPCKFSWRKGCHGEGDTNPKVGKTREEMMVDGRLARIRQEAEMADRKTESQPGRNAATDWWDAHHQV
ncbi:hypothetical protein G7046_g762 [Stylonectria norvegica]|nr:hypothetical protein G7046_g762 [Stylonectria norvegica]